MREESAVDSLGTLETAGWLPKVPSLRLGGGCLVSLILNYLNLSRHHSLRSHLHSPLIPQAAHRHLQTLLKSLKPWLGCYNVFLWLLARTR